MIRETLEAAKSQLIATLHVLDVALAAMEQQPTTCPHEQKIDISSFTTPGKWYCPACRTEGGVTLAEGG
jgi:hypothetical protein